MGLQLEIADALVPLRNPRFVVKAVIASFVLGPALAYLITVLVPTERSYASGVLLLGMAPAAPFLPAFVRRQPADHGDARDRYVGHTYLLLRSRTMVRSFNAQSVPVEELERT